MTAEREQEEDAVIHRTRCAVANATEALKMLGLYEMVKSEPGCYAAVKLDPSQRRDLLVFLSELDELTKCLKGMKADLATDIERTRVNMNASAAYRRTGVSLRKYARPGQH